MPLLNPSGYQPSAQQMYYWSDYTSLGSQPDLGQLPSIQQVQQKQQQQPVQGPQQQIQQRWLAPQQQQSGKASRGACRQLDLGQTSLNRPVEQQQQSLQGPQQQIQPMVQNPQQQPSDLDDREVGPQPDLSIPQAITSVQHQQQISTGPQQQNQQIGRAHQHKQSDQADRAAWLQIDLSQPPPILSVQQQLLLGPQQQIPHRGWAPQQHKSDPADAVASALGAVNGFIVRLPRNSLAVVPRPPQLQQQLRARQHEQQQSQLTPSQQPQLQQQQYTTFVPMRQPVPYGQIMASHHSSLIEIGVTPGAPQYLQQQQHLYPQLDQQPRQQLPQQQNLAQRKVHQIQHNHLPSAIHQPLSAQMAQPSFAYQPMSVGFPPRAPTRYVAVPHPYPSSNAPQYYNSIHGVPAQSIPQLSPAIPLLSPASSFSEGDDYDDPKRLSSACSNIPWT